MTQPLWLFATHLERISAEIGDEFLGLPGTLPTSCYENVAILTKQ
jgi:hypothetical protein